MSLVFQNNGIAGSRTHAFIVGVSDYANLPDPNPPVIGKPEWLGLKKLSSPALSAWQISQWLIKNGADLAQGLASVRLLLAPSPLEQLAEPALKGAFTRPTWDNFAQEAKAWREESCSDPNSVAFFYFSGHGAQFRRDNLVMLMQDFGNGIGAVFNKTVELSNLVNGMAPGEPPADLIARNQLYFIDACRSDELADKAKSEQQVPSVFTEVSGPDDRNRPILFATLDGRVAMGRKGQVSHFCDALLRAFDTACDVSRPNGHSNVWPVTVDSVRYSLQVQFIERGLTQRPFLQGGAATDLDIRILRNAPSYGVTLSLDVTPPLDPDTCISETKIEVLDEDGKIIAVFPKDGCNHPYEMSLPMGVYDIVVNGPTRRVQKTVILNQRQKNPVRILVA